MSLYVFEGFILILAKNVLTMHTIADLQGLFLKHLQENPFNKQPDNLYQPINYIMNLKGKRLRPTLTLLTAELFDESYERALPAAMAVEIFHNFSLVHDDIMDEAPLRRGHETVHKKWNLNTGILSGDAMLILAYQYFDIYEPKVYKKLAKLFTRTALEVCEGQQLDVDFETRNDVTVEEYLKMIAYKTAVLVAAAMRMGAIVAKADKEDGILMYQFGLNLGIAFQLQDDYLDAFGDPDLFGKQIGGDIIENKKTYLYLKALENATPEDQNTLLELFNSKPENPEEKIKTVRNLFIKTGSDKATQLAIQEYTEKALSVLDSINLSNKRKEILIAFANQLMGRES